jgi:hypothetical protein
MPATNTTRYTVTERFDADQAAVWTARAGRRVAVTVIAPKEHGMWDTDLLRKALAEHAGVSVENVRPRRTPSDRQIAPRVWEVVLPEEAPAEDAPAAEAPKTCPGCSAPEGEPCRDALLDLIAEEPTPVTAEVVEESEPTTPAAVEDVEEVDYRMFVGVLFEDAKDMGLHKAANVRAAITNNAAEGHRAVRTESGMIHVYYSWFVPQRAAVEEAAPAEGEDSAPVVTREPKHEGYDTLGNGDAWGEDYYLLINGGRVGGSYFCNADSVKDGERWASWGPAGLSMGHPTREAAEAVQVDAWKAAGAVAAEGEAQERPEVAEAPEEDIVPTARTVYLVALAEPVKGYTMAGTTVRTEYVREAIRTAARVEVKAARVGTEGIIRVGSLLYIPQALTTA